MWLCDTDDRGGGQFPQFRGERRRPIDLRAFVFFERGLAGRPFEERGTSFPGRVRVDPRFQQRACGTQPGDAPQLSTAGGAAGVVKCTADPTCDPNAFNVTKHTVYAAFGCNGGALAPPLCGFFGAGDFPCLCSPTLVPVPASTVGVLLSPVHSAAALVVLKRVHFVSTGSSAK